MLPLVLATAAFVPPRAPLAVQHGRSPLLWREAALAVAPLHARRRDVYMEAYEMKHVEDETMYDELIEQASKGDGAALCQADAIAGRRAWHWGLAWPARPTSGRARVAERRKRAAP